MWIDAIKKDHLNWTNISDLKGWKNALSGKYDISAIPANVLISPNGKIIARNLYGNALIKILEKVLQ